jgi:malic enzyme
MGIPVGKLALYVAGAGIHPAKVLPVSLDVGTNNPALLDDPLYLGHRARRITGDAYDAFLEAFVAGVRTVFPRAVVQWEDFHKRNAFRILEKYRRRVPSFNDDIQGTAAVAVAAVLAALRITQLPIEEQRVVFLGAGEACTGIVQLLESAMREAGASREQICASRLVFDSRGLLREGGEIDDPHKRALAAPRDVLAHYGMDGLAAPTPEDAIRRMRPTVLVGATATPGTFRPAMIEELARGVERPIVLPLSNPTHKAECSAQEAIAWSGGRALVATGSPFADVVFEGTRHVIGQANNVFVFPGVGLGAILAELREIDESVFLVAARALAECVSEERLRLGALLPDTGELRVVSACVAAAVVRHASTCGTGRRFGDGEIERAVSEASWWPAYVPVVKA